MIIVLLNIIISYSTFVHVMDAAVSSDKVMDISKVFVAEYCKFLHSTAEPHIVIYNRIPKTGSTSVNKLLKYISQQEGLPKFLSFNKTFWVRCINSLYFSS